MWTAIDTSNAVDVIACIVALFLLAHIVMGSTDEDKWDDEHTRENRDGE